MKSIGQTEPPFSKCQVRSVPVGKMRTRRHQLYHAKLNLQCVSETGRHEMCDLCDLCIMRHRKATLAGGFKDTIVSPDKFLLSEYILSTEAPPSFRLTMTNCSLSLSGFWFIM